ncbi:unnamed protein product [Polarella glacialis]|uniref:Uncharacterized protein n=1 Tax=Polarella glacialis TaxID=89957 RepID=A0A813DJD3_POLGL|nr:unnamed protein product [Polarella glacialis]
MDMLAYGVAIAAAAAGAAAEPTAEAGGLAEEPTRWQQALALWSEMLERGLWPDMLVLNTLMSALDKGNAWQAALAFLCQDTCGWSKVSPDVATISMAINVCSRCHQWEHALGVWEDFKPVSGKSQVLPDVMAYSAAIVACEKGGRKEPHK